MRDVLPVEFLTTEDFYRTLKVKDGEFGPGYKSMAFHTNEGEISFSLLSS